jgi:DNA invertase Pin-like site-specific DNA recombinase
MMTGYARVSSLFENIQIQTQKLETAGCKEIVREKLSSKKDRPNLKIILEKLRPGDFLVVTRIDRIAISLRDLSHILNKIRKAEANICFLDHDIDTCQLPAMLEVARHFAEFDNTLTQANLPASRPGPKRRFSDDQILEMLRMYENKGKVADICTRFNVSESSFWRFRSNHRQSTAGVVQ